MFGAWTVGVGAHNLGTEAGDGSSFPHNLAACGLDLLLGLEHILRHPVSRSVPEGRSEHMTVPRPPVVSHCPSHDHMKGIEVIDTLTARHVILPCAAHG